MLAKGLREGGRGWLIKTAPIKAAHPGALYRGRPLLRYLAGLQTANLAREVNPRRLRGVMLMSRGRRCLRGGESVLYLRDALVRERVPSQDCRIELALMRFFAVQVLNVWL